VCECLTLIPAPLIKNMLRASGPCVRMAFVLQNTLCYRQCSVRMTECVSARPWYQLHLYCSVHQAGYPNAPSPLQYCQDTGLRLQGEGQTNGLWTSVLNKRGGEGLNQYG
jgi:hypothetical protein